MGKDKDFSKIYHVLVDKGILARLSGKEIKIFLAINRFADYQTGIAKPTVMTIVKLSGVSKNHIRKAVEKLEAAGLILTKRTGERFMFRKIYGIVKKDWIEPDVALSVISKGKNRRRIMVRGDKGRFERIPENTESPIPVTVESKSPEDTEGAIPEDKERRIVPENTEEKESIRDNIRDTYIERKIPDTSSGIGKKHLVNKIGLYAQEHGFDKAMKLQEGKPQGSSDSESFEKQVEAERADSEKFLGLKR